MYVSISISLFKLCQDACWVWAMIIRSLVFSCQVCLPRCPVWCRLMSSCKSSSWSSKSKAWPPMIPLDSVRDWPLDFWGPLKVKAQSQLSAQSQTRPQPLQVKRLRCSFRYALWTLLAVVFDLLTICILFFRLLGFTAVYIGIHIKIFGSKCSYW